MFVVTITSPEGDTQELSLNEKVALIGRSKSCHVMLSGWRAAREHARLMVTNQGIMIEDMGHMSGTWINGSRIVQHGPLDFADEILIAGYKLRVQAKASTNEPEALATRPVVDQLLPPRIQLVDVKKTQSNVTINGASNHFSSVRPGYDLAKVQARYPWRKRIHGRLLETIDLRRRDLTRMSDIELRAETEKLIKEIVAAEHEIPAEIDKPALIKEVLDEAIGLGPLEELLADDSVTEVMVNRHDEIFVEQRGQLQQHPLSFTSDRAVLGVIERIVAPLGRRIDESSPMVDARLKDGSRVNAIIPPLALKGPTLTIRKFSKKKLQAEDMVAYGSVSAEMVAFLKFCVLHRKNMIVAGGTGSGKTTFLNVLSNFIPDGERIVTIEDAAELKLNHSHLVSLESRPSNVEGRGAVQIRDLVKNSLRMRPDRIVVGECRGGEALDMLQAMNTGHEGSLTTLHANTPRDALARLETLILMAGMDLPLPAIREQIASAVDILVQQTRFACGSRKVTSITEITGIENGKIQMQEIFKFERRGYDDNGKVRGAFTGCDSVPSFYDELREQGAELDMAIFNKKAA
jgi:pilus assembly protein CpaF